MHKVLSTHRRRTRTAVDLFCGSGSVTAALRASGFDVVAAVDIDPVCAATYKANHPTTTFFNEDIRKLRPWRIAQSIPRYLRLDVLVVCAPCQPFSTQNRFRTSTDERLDLVLEAVRFIRHLLPNTIIFENVPGIEKSDTMKKLLRQLARLGYYFSKPERLDAAHLGVPQRRVRCLLVASRDRKVVRKVGELRSVKERKVTVRQALRGLQSLESGQEGGNDRLHRARVHSSLNLERLKHIPKDGGSRISLPEHLVLSCHARLNNQSKFPDVYGRMAWNDVAPTLTTGCTDLTRGRYGHPDNDRAITLREAARLQTFPDGYKFAGNSAQIAMQIGNAVPMEMMRSIISHLGL